MQYVDILFLFVVVSVGVRGACLRGPDVSHDQVDAVSLFVLS